MTSPAINSKPEIANNQPASTVADALQGFIGGATSSFKDTVYLDIASAYFNLGGYAELSSALDDVGKVRLLLGAEPEDVNKPRVISGPDAISLSSKTAEKKKTSYAVESLVGNLKTDRDLLGFTYETDQIADHLISWLKSEEKVEVRLLKKRFLHGKAYLISTTTLKHGVIAGSSNFTRAGLTTNAELNLGNYNPSIVEKAQAWFEEHWADAEPYDLVDLYKERYEHHSPYLIYLRMLQKWNEAELDLLEDYGTFLPLAQSQKDGLWRARGILKDYNGVLIADEVGLGKTYLAGELILDATRNRRQRALVIAPATLRDGTWKAFKDKHNINVEIRSFEDLTSDIRLNPKYGNASNKLSADPNEYSLVVIDEAHNARNPSAQRAEALRRLLSGTPRKKVVLLTATPVNNSLWDLYHLLGYFIYNDAIFADTGIKSLREHFNVAMKKDPDELSPKHLFDVIDPVTVRRTRKFIKKHYSGDVIPASGADSEELVIKFPKPHAERIDYDFDSATKGFFKKFKTALDPGSKAQRGKNKASNKLTLARYTPSAYLLNGNEITYEAQQAGLLRSMLLKRFESSPYAFANTCERMAKSHEKFLGLLEDGIIATSEMLSEWASTDSDELSEEDSDEDSEDGDSGKVERYTASEAANGYDVKTLKADVSNDLKILQEFASEARLITREKDPTLKVVVEELAEIAAEAENTVKKEDVHDRRKVLIFSYFADTVDWIYNHLTEVVQSDSRLSVYADRVASISGSDGKSSGGNVTKQAVLWGFAPHSTEAPTGFDQDKFDIVVTTDVLAEGVNLQQAQHIINYDLPWNPMRLVQRHGRIDRIGSSHDEVFIRSVFPAAALNELLGLEERIRLKIRQAAAAVGVDSDIIPGESGRNQVFTETREEIEKLRQGDAGIFEQGGVGLGATSGEEFRHELKKALTDRPGLKTQIEALPWGSGSGMVADHLSGTSTTEFIFCAQIAGSEKVQFRSVVVDDNGPSSNGTTTDITYGITDNTLACLFKARPDSGESTERVLSDDTFSLAYGAWDAAAEEIKTSWNQLSDPKELSAPLEKAQRDAIDALRSLKELPANQDQAGINTAVEKLQNPLKSRRPIQKIRLALKEHPDDPTAQAAGLLEVIEDLGLEPYVPPTPNPVINKDDVHLVCWLALTAPQKS